MSWDQGPYRVTDDCIRPVNSSRGASASSLCSAAARTWRAGSAAPTSCSRSGDGRWRAARTKAGSTGSPARGCCASGRARSCCAPQNASSLREGKARRAGAAAAGYHPADAAGAGRRARHQGTLTAGIRPVADVARSWLGRPGIAEAVEEVGSGGDLGCGSGRVERCPPPEPIGCGGWWSIEFVALGVLAWSGCHGLWRRPRGVHCQPFEVLDGGGEQELVAGPARSAQSQAIEA